MYEIERILANTDDSNFTIIMLRKVVFRLCVNEFIICSRQVIIAMPAAKLRTI